MSPSIRTVSRLTCALVIAACNDNDPSAPIDSAIAAPELMIEGGAGYPTAEEFAAMPAEFGLSPTLTRYWTDAGFIAHENKAYGQSFMEYWATNARQELKLDLRFEHGSPISKFALSENDNWFPAWRTLWTTTSLGVMGSCGHIVEGAATHSAWHKFLFDGWKALRWGDKTRPSSDSDFQPYCPPPPQDGEVDDGEGGGDGTTSGGGDYEGECEICQQWFYVIAGNIVDEWWECEPAPNSACGLAET
jgi:hypothetical protein